MALEGALEKLLPSGSASSELEGVIEQLHSLQDMSHQIVNHFSNVSGSTGGTRFTIQKITPALEELKQDFTKQDAQLAELGDAYADFEQDIKHLTARRESIARDIAQVPALEVELEKV